MISNKHVHIKRIKEVAVRLDYLLKDVVFVGGSVVALYADDPAAEEVRPTEDVDIVVGIFTTHGFYDFESAIRKQGFLNDTNIDEGITGHLDRSTSSFRLRRIKDIWTSFIMS